MGALALSLVPEPQLTPARRRRGTASAVQLPALRLSGMLRRGAGARAELRRAARRRRHPERIQPAGQLLQCSAPARPACQPPSHCRSPRPALQAGWTAEDGEIFAALWGSGPLSASCKVRGQALLVANKADLTGAGGGGGREVLLPLVARDAFKQVVRTSALTREGLEALEAAILQLAGAPELASGGRWAGRCPGDAGCGCWQLWRAAGAAHDVRPGVPSSCGARAPPLQAACRGRSTRGRRRRSSARTRR
jgi:hypothetical protein